MSGVTICDVGPRDGLQNGEAILEPEVRAELVNRLDQIVVFHPLQPDEIAKVADIAIGRLAERRGLTQAGVLLDISPASIARMAEGGFSAELGARALRRAHRDCHPRDRCVVARADRLRITGSGCDGFSLPNL